MRFCTSSIYLCVKNCLLMHFTHARFIALLLTFHSHHDSLVKVSDYQLCRVNKQFILNSIMIDYKAFPGTSKSLYGPAVQQKRLVVRIFRSGSTVSASRVLKGYGSRRVSSNRKMSGFQLTDLAETGWSTVWAALISKRSDVPSLQCQSQLTAFSTNPAAVHLLILLFQSPGFVEYYNAGRILWLYILKHT